MGQHALRTEHGIGGFFASRTGGTDIAQAMETGEMGELALLIADRNHLQFIDEWRAVFFVVAQHGAAGNTFAQGSANQSQAFLGILTMLQEAQTTSLQFVAAITTQLLEGTI